MATKLLSTPNLRVAAYAVFLFAIILAPILHAQGTDELKQALEELCCQLQKIVPVTAMLLVIAAGVIYSIGQMFGAETRARANVWATSCLTGAVIGILIAQVAPHVLGIIAGATITCGACV
ncbi:MAG: TrbC/VirB2 family protein [Candidatus Micrarchaeota archaeon]